MVMADFKAGDWVDIEGEPHLVFRDSPFAAINEGGCFNVGMAGAKLIPGCTGWNWKPIKAGAGYRLLDPAVDKREPNDEFPSSDAGWSRSGLNYFFPDTIYRRKISPPVPTAPAATHRPYATQVEAIEGLRGILVKEKDEVMMTARLVEVFYPQAVSVALAGLFGFEQLFAGWVKLDGTPCGVRL